MMIDECSKDGALFPLPLGGPIINECFMDMCTRCPNRAEHGRFSGVPHACCPRTILQTNWSKWSENFDPFFPWVFDSFSHVNAFLKIFSSWFLLVLDRKLWFIKSKTVLTCPCSFGSERPPAKTFIIS